MNLFPIPTFSDNYVWALFDQDRALVVDPGEADPILKWLEANQLRLDAIFVTHHHADHIGGVAELYHKTQALIYAPETEWLGHSLPCVRVSSQLNPVLSVVGCTWYVLSVPGHTLGHIAYYSPRVQTEPLEEMQQGVLFCGDTLFSGGCGRLFEGTAADMYTSLQTLSSLPEDTLVCCAHEYTISNINFAQVVEPLNQRIKDYMAHCQLKVKLKQPTLPSTIKTEKEINPFLRVSNPTVKEAVMRNQHPSSSYHPEDILFALREWKNRFS